jgi:uncharacterized RDD family membrane protein YckC
LSNAVEHASTGRPARVARRIAALVYDLMLLGAMLFMFTLAVFIVRGRAVAPGTLWFQLCLAAIVVWFFTWFWVHGGQTLGMKAWRLRVVDMRGGAVGWSSALIRFAAGLLAALPAGLGLWWAAFDRDRRAWHDRISGTRVVHEARASAQPQERDRSDDE